MEQIKITFLGTSNAIPTSQRSHPAMLLEYGAEKILIDCGEGTQRQFKLAGLNPCKLTRVLLTHLHGDHVLGLPGLMETLGMSEYARTLLIYGPKHIASHIEMLERIYGRFNLKYEVHEFPTSIENKDFKIEALPMVHGAPTYAYAFIIKEKHRIDKKKLKKLKLPNSPLLGELQKGKDIMFNNKKIKAKDLTYTQPGKKATIIMDTKLNDNAIELAKDSDLLICEATYAENEKEYAENYKHLTSTQAATIAKKAKAKKLILTHISQRYEHDLKRIELEAKKVFKNVSIAKDFDIVEI